LLQQQTQKMSGKTFWLNLCSYLIQCAKALPTTHQHIHPAKRALVSRDRGWEEEGEEKGGGRERTSGKEREKERTNYNDRYRYVRVNKIKKKNKAKMTHKNRRMGIFSSIYLFLESVSQKTFLP